MGRDHHRRAIAHGHALAGARQDAPGGIDLRHLDMVDQQRIGRIAVVEGQAQAVATNGQAHDLADRRIAQRRQRRSPVQEPPAWPRPSCARSRPARDWRQPKEPLLSEWW
jgi:hypothetical protein